MKDALKDRVSEVLSTDRLVDSPAIISDHDNAVTRRMMQVSACAWERKYACVEGGGGYL